MDRRCVNCKRCYEGVCCNGDSEHRADFRLEDETCEEWEENDEAKGKNSYGGELVRTRT